MRKAKAACNRCVIHVSPSNCTCVFAVIDRCALFCAKLAVLYLFSPLRVFLLIVK